MKRLFTRQHAADYLGMSVRAFDQGAGATKHRKRPDILADIFRCWLEYALDLQRRGKDSCRTLEYPR